MEPFQIDLAAKGRGGSYQAVLKINDDGSATIVVDSEISDEFWVHVHIAPEQLQQIAKLCPLVDK